MLRDLYMPSKSLPVAFTHFLISTQKIHLAALYNILYIYNQRSHFLTVQAVHKFSTRDTV